MVNNKELLERAKKLIMQRIVEKDNVTFDELEYILNENNLYEEEKDVDNEKEDEEVQLWEIWFNDKNLILWHTQNKVLVEAWHELAKEGRFDVYSTPFLTYGTYNVTTGRIPQLPLAPEEVWRKAGHPGYPPLTKKYWKPIEMRCNSKSFETLAALEEAVPKSQ